MNKRSRPGVLGKRESTEGILLYLPAILIVFGIVFFPMAYAVVMSFTGYRVSKPVMNFIGLKNYAKILADPGFGDAVLRSIVFTFGSLIPQIVLGLAMAMLLNSPRLRCKTLFRGLAITPWLIPTVAVAIVFRWMFNDIYGIINHAAIGMGFIEDSFAWLSNSTGAMFVMILANVWRGTPLLLTQFLAGLQGIPGDVYEAAQVDGANAWERFSQITVPLLLPVLMVSGVLRFIWTFNFYDLPWVLTGGGPVDATTTTPIYAYKRAFSSYRMGEGSAITILLFLILLIFAVVYFYFRNRQDDIYR